MSTPQASAVVAPTTEGGKMDMANAAAVTKMSGGGVVLTPLPLVGGRRSRKISKKVLKQLKKMGSRKVMKMLKKGGAEEMMTAEPAAPTEETGGRRRKSRKTRRASRKSRRGFFY
jgi:hypothetical protein